MTKSTLPVKHQTTVPKEIQEKPNAGRLQGRFKVGPGDPVEDVRRARELMGTGGL